VVVQDRLVHGHGDQVWRLEAERRVELGALERGQVDGADDHPLVGHAHPGATRQAVLGEQDTQGRREPGDVDDLAVAHHPGIEVDHADAAKAQAALVADLGGRDVARLDVESDHAG